MKAIYNINNNIVQQEKSDPLFTPGPTHYDIKDISHRSPAWKISESKRSPIDLNLFTKKCGSYNYKSFIGEGPKYTISKKCNIDGTTDGTRHPKAPVVTPFPGPGTYEIKSELGGPKYTIGEKRLAKSLSQDNILVPGVGSYQLRKDSSLDIPCYRFGREQRDNLNMNKEALKNPGPGMYNTDKDNNSSIAPKWSFSRADRFTRIKPRNPNLKRFIVPGPGSYKLIGATGNEGPKFTFSKEKFNHSDSYDESLLNKIKNYPSPVTYNQNIAFVPDKPSYTIPKMDRNKNNSVDSSKYQFPSPCHYNPNKDVSSTLRGVTNCIISKSRRDEDELVNSKIKKVYFPGPGHYNIKNGDLPQGPKYTIGHVNKIFKIGSVPGPGAYEINDNNRPKEPSYSIGKEERGDDLKYVKRNNYPGPGKYNTSELNISPKYSFPKDATSANKRFDVPGPGFYKIPTSFDYISDMTRSQGSFDPTYRYV